MALSRVFRYFCRSNRNNNNKYISLCHRTSEYKFCSPSISRYDFVELWSKQRNGLFFAAFNRYHLLQMFAVDDATETSPHLPFALVKSSLLDGASIYAFVSGHALNKQQQTLLHDGLIHWSQGLLSEQEVKDAIQASTELTPAIALQKMYKLVGATAAKVSGWIDNMSHSLLNEIYIYLLLQRECFIFSV